MTRTKVKPKFASVGYVRKTIHRRYLSSLADDIETSIVESLYNSWNTHTHTHIE